jgi:hypothetical protein
MSDHCGTTTEDGNAVCVPGACSCSSEAQNNAPILLSLPSVDEYKSTFKQLVTRLKKAISSNHIEEKSHVEENS